MIAGVDTPARDRRVTAAARALACAVAFYIALAALSPATAFASTAASATPDASPARARTVIVVLAPYLSWSDLTAEKTPAIHKLLESAALGSLNARSADTGWPTYAGGALTISAGRWATGPTGGPIDAASLDRAREANADSLSPPTLGLLGDALQGAGLRTVAAGASDTSTVASGRLRPAELIATDGSGTVNVRFGDSQVADASAPFGLRTDTRALVSDVASALTGAPGLIVVDTSDLSRAHDASATPDAYRANHAAAVTKLDDLVGELSLLVAQGAGDGVMLAIVPVATNKEWYKAPEFGPLILAGGGFSGEILSASTRRAGLATNLDIGPTVLAALGVEVPAQMLGRPLTSRADATSVDERIARYALIDASVGTIDRLRDAWLARWFCYAAIAAIALATLLIAYPMRRAAFAGEAALIVVLAAMPAGWLMLVVRPWPINDAGALHAFIVATALIVAAAFGVRALWPSRAPAAALFLTTLTSFAIALDQWTGNPFESGIFSYSIAAGWRYYGIGNEGAAILVGSSIAALALAADCVPERFAGAVRRFGIPVVGSIVVVTAAAPFAGANAGAAVWGVVAYCIAWAAMNGIRLTWRSAAVTLGAVVVVVAAFSAIDLLQAKSGGSHLARFAGGILQGDISGTAELVRRKLANNLGLLTRTTFTWVALAMAAALVALRFAPGRPLRAGLAETPAYGKAVVGIIVGGLVAWATEDSGTVMPALMLLAGIGPAFVIVLRRQSQQTP
ncbi:MAG: hypothetical protein HGB10_05060 [Coriobacteriia bacterium]|nr:hypothetical protein [Coriobacteriia bacterium]